MFPSDIPLSILKIKILPLINQTSLSGIMKRTTPSMSRAPTTCFMKLGSNILEKALAPIINGYGNPSGS